MSRRIWKPIRSFFKNPPKSIARWINKRVARAIARGPAADEIRRLTAHMVEKRARIAAMEAKSYADEGFSALSASMRAAHKVVARSTVRLDHLERRLDDMGSALNREIGLSLAEDGYKGHWRRDVEAALGNLERDFSNLNVAYGDQLRGVEQRIEFIRSETMYEMQASLLKAGKAKAESEGGAVPQVLNPTKLQDMRTSGLRINIGCGHIQPEGFLNVDGRALPGVDIVSEATSIPLADGEVDEIFSSHLVEHFTRHMLERVLLPNWVSLLKPGGTLTTVAPDGAAMLSAVNSGEMTFDDFREVLFGGQDYDGDFHYNLIVPDDFAALLARVGFTDITQDYVGKRNGKCFEFKISARKAG